MYSSTGGQTCISLSRAFFMSVLHSNSSIFKKWPFVVVRYPEGNSGGLLTLKDNFAASSTTSSLLSIPLRDVHQKGSSSSSSSSSKPSHKNSSVLKRTDTVCFGIDQGWVNIMIYSVHTNRPFFLLSRQNPMVLRILLLWTIKGRT